MSVQKILVPEIKPKILVTTDNSKIIGVNERKVEILLIGSQVSAGTSNQFEISCNSGSALSSNRILALTGSNTVIYADKDVLSHTDSIVGISKTSTSGAGQVITVITQGLVSEPSWTWTPEQPLFLSTNGFLTHSPPTSGSSLYLGYAVTTSSIFLRIGEPCDLI